jgi:hypothetical protein
MATVAGVKVPKKKVRAVSVRKTGKATFTFAEWEHMSGEQYHRRVRSIRSELYADHKAADLAVELYAWMKENGYSAEDIAAAKECNPSVAISITCKLLRAGMPDINPKHVSYWESLGGTSGEMKPVTVHVKTHITDLIAKGKPLLAEKKLTESDKKETYVPSIQERITEQSWNTAEPIAEWLEGFITDKASFDPKGFNFKTHFTKAGTTQAHARKIKGFFERELADFQDLERMPTAGQLKKMDQAEADRWEQLKEGYSHLKKVDIKKYTDAIEHLMQALDYIIDAAKATRAPRKAKPKSADKIIAKLKYLKLDDKYKLASINPVDIVGANELWVFNVKTRKLGKYVASNIDPTGMGRNGSGLQVKGTTITGYNEALSIQKTLRKPEEQLKEFKNAGKVALRKFLDDINAIDTKMNGRCNADTVLLKVN